MCGLRHVCNSVLSVSNTDQGEPDLHKQKYLFSALLYILSCIFFFIAFSPFLLV